MSLTLEQLIDQQIELGHKNPHEFYDLLERALGEDIIEVARPYLADFISEMARQRMNRRRHSDIAKISTRSVQDPRTLLDSLWVPESDAPGITYKRISDMTAEDYEARAAFLERMAHGIRRHAQWCRDNAQLLRDNNCTTSGELGYLAPLRDDTDNTDN